MKSYILPALLGLLTSFSSLSAEAQKRVQTRTGTPDEERNRHRAEETIKREFTLTGDAGRSTFALYNINGPVKVEGYSGKQVVVEITKTIKAPTAELLAQGQKEAQPGFLQRNDSVVVYLQGPQDSRPRRSYRNNGWNDRDIDYEYIFEFTVRVPADMNVRVSTVNGSQVLVENVAGALQANNVNGAVVIRNAREATRAHTVNGNVDVSYVAAPTAPASYQTINGNITVSYPPNVSADLHFKSLHGEMFTDFPTATVQPAKVTQNKENHGGGTRYKLSKDTAVRLGQGGPDFRFETINGNVTIKQQTR